MQKISSPLMGEDEGEGDESCRGRIPARRGQAPVPSRMAGVATKTIVCRVSKEGSPSGSKNIPRLGRRR